MPTYGRPGIYVTESLIGPSPAPNNVNPSNAGFIGEHWKGPIGKAVACSNWAQFVQYFGGFLSNYPTASGVAPTLANGWLPYAVYEFFNNGGQTAWINRIVNSSTPGASASTILLDQAATPQNTLTVSAGLFGIVGSPGTWGNSLYVDVTANPAGAGQFNLIVYAGGYGASYVVEQWLDLTMIPSSPRYALSVVNAVGTGSLYIALTNDNSATASPNNAPAAVTGKQLTGGVDPADPAVTDREAAVTSPCPMDYVPNVLNFAMPGETTTAVVSSAITYASTRPYTFFVMDCPQGQSPAQVVTYAQSIGYGTSSSISQASLYYPWVVASNPGNNNAISTITMPPSGFVLGQIATMDTNIGPWYPPAGTNTSLVGAVGTERTLSPTDLATLNLANVDAIRQRPDGNTIIWGARTMLTGYATQYINVRRMLNYVEASLASLLTSYVFAPNDQVLWAQIVATCTQFLSGLAHQNAFAGTTAADQFYVTCDDTNNTPTSIQSGVVNVTVGLALLYPAEFIALNISQFQNSGTSTVSSTTP